MDDAIEQTPAPDKAELRVIRAANQDGTLFTMFVALTDTELNNFLESGGEVAAIKKHILLVVDGHTPSQRDHEDAQGAFAQCYGDRYYPHPARSRPDPEVGGYNDQLTTN